MFVEQIFDHGDVWFRQALEVYSPKHLVPDLHNHLSLSRREVLLDGVLLQSATSSCDES